MKTYVDTSVLCSLYGSDNNSARADAWRANNPSPLPFSAFHRFELRNALSLAIFRGHMTEQQVQLAWQNIEADVSAGLLVFRGGLWHRVLKAAESLALLQTPKIGSRSLDVIHVAAAKLMRADKFCTFDARQAKLAEAVGLTVAIV